MSEFTKGPWHWEKDRFRDGFSGLYAGNDPVLYPQRENDGDDGAAWFGIDEDYYGETALKETDACLISAAPDLLDALIALKTANGGDDFNGWHEGFDSAIEKARAAIAKALGTTER